MANGREVVGCHASFGKGYANNNSPRISDTLPFRIYDIAGSLQDFMTRPNRPQNVWEYKNPYTAKPGQQDHSVSEWFHRFSELVGEKTALELTVELRNAAKDEWAVIKNRVEVNKEIMPLVFEWDEPRPQVWKPLV